MKVYSCGTKVHFTAMNVEAMITAFSVRFNNTTYELTYVVNNDYRTTWVHESEFTVEGATKQIIGYKTA